MESSMMVPSLAVRVAAHARRSGSAADHSAHPEGTGRVRSARLDDAAALAALLDAAGAPDFLPLRASDVQGWLDRGQLLVLDDDGQLAAAAFLEQRGDRAQLELLVVDPSHHGHGIEERMLGVASALVEAFELPEIDIATIRQRRSRGRR